MSSVWIETCSTLRAMETEFDFICQTLDKFILLMRSSARESEPKRPRKRSKPDDGISKSCLLRLKIQARSWRFTLSASNGVLRTLLAPTFAMCYRYQTAPFHLSKPSLAASLPPPRTSSGTVAMFVNSIWRHNKPRQPQQGVGSSLAYI